MMLNLRLATIAVTGVLFVCLPVLVWSDQASDKTVSDLKQLLPKDCDHTGHFMQSRRQQYVAKPLLSYGRFVFSCRHGLIWHTRAPLEDTFIYPLGRSAQRLYQGKVEPVDSRVQEQVGVLLNQLIGGDTSYIEKHFMVTSDVSHASLTPKRSRLKKYLQRIDIEQNAEEIAITMNLKNGDSNRISVFESKPLSGLSLQSCQSLHMVPEQACGALFRAQEQE